MKVLESVNENIKESNKVLNELKMIIVRLSRIIMMVNVVNILTIIVLLILIVL